MASPAVHGVPTPLPLADPSGLRRGLHAGDVHADPVPSAPRAGRVRRWSYVAAGDGDALVGAAVVDLGAVGTAFAFAHVAGRCVTWETTRPLRQGIEVGRLPANGARVRTRTASVRLAGDGAIDLDVPTAAGRLRARVATTASVTPAVLATRTAAGGWNVTRKVAGTSVVGSLQLGDGAPAALSADAGGWSDWTCGRQDRRTTWRWAAGAGVDADGRRVGINASTGMNGEEAGEDVVWWDGVPHALPVRHLAPAGPEPSGGWSVTAPGTDLRLDPVGVRAADERLGVVTSSYVQPFGRWRGELTDPRGQVRRVRLAGVAEDHLAVW